MTTPTERVVPDPAVVRRQLDMFDHHAAWTAAHPGEDPDDDAEFVARAREIMGLLPLPEE